jgi:hypothetical protein
MTLADPQPCFAFRSQAFNTIKEKEYFINPCCFGDDLARWLISQLRDNGHATEEEPGQEDFGWYFGFEIVGVKHDIVIGYRPDPDPGDGEWLCWIERKAGLVGSMLGKRRHVRPEALEALREILSSSSVISSVRSCSESDP